MAVSASNSLSPAALEGRVRGRIITPADADYDALRTVVAGHIDRRPAYIVRVADANDVAEVIDLARETGAELAVRSGGHSGAGHSATDGGIVLDVRELTEIDLDVAGRAAWAGSGLPAATFTNAAGEHGLAVGFGDTGTVGLGGLTLGGGVGYLVRKLGLTIDSLLAADIITADGQLRRVDADTEPDLFWAIRGGGGNFGVVTRFQFRLHEVPEAYGGMLILPATAEVIAGFMTASEAAPSELSSILNVMPAPPMPGIPEETVGQIVAAAVMCYAGDPDAAERALAPFRALGTPILDALKPMQYAEIYPPDEGEYRPLAEARTMFIDRVDRSVATLILERLAASDSPMRVTQLRPLGGAVAAVPVDATAYAHRHRRIMVNVAAFYEGEADRPRRLAWVKELADDLRQGDDGAYVNFLVEGEDAKAAYPGGTWDRLRAVKAAYDPSNLFRMNANIPPAG